MISIREFCDGDAADAAVVYYESFKTYLNEKALRRSAGYWQNAMKRFQSDEYDNISFVAVDTNQVIGCITITAALRRGVGSLQRIGVLPEYAGKGIGRMLFSTADRFWRERNMRKVFVSVSSNNPTAVNFYRSCGFEHEATLKEHIFPGVDEYIMSIFY